MLEQSPARPPAPLPPALVADVADAPSTSAHGCLCARDEAGVTELWWNEDGTCSLAQQVADLSSPKASASALSKPGSSSPGATPPSASAFAKLPSPVHLRIDSFIPVELLLATFSSLAPRLASLDYYDETIRDAGFEARVSAALAPAASTLTRLRIVYNPPLELLPLDAPPRAPPSESPFYQLLPSFTRLTELSITCTRYLAPGAFVYLPPALEHLTIEVLRPCDGLSVPEALLAALGDEENDVKELKRLTVLDDDEEGWEGLEDEVAEAARRRGLKFERVGEARLASGSE